MYKISTKDIAKAVFNLGRRSPTSKYLDIAIEISTLAEHFKEEPPKGLFPMSYHTLDYEKELKYHNRLKELVDRYKV
jgi:hypothetical protein